MVLPRKENAKHCKSERTSCRELLTVIDLTVDYGEEAWRVQGSTFKKKMGMRYEWGCGGQEILSAGDCQANN